MDRLKNCNLRSSLFFLYVGEPKDLIEMLFHYKEEMQKEGKEDMNLITDTHIKQTVSDVFGGIAYILFDF